MNRFLSINKVFKLFIYINIFISSCQSAFGEKEEIDRVKNNLTEDVFTEIHKQTYEAPVVARDKSFELLNQVLESDIESRVKLLKYIGSSYVFETNYPEAIKYYSQSLSLAEESKDYHETANLNNNLGMIFNELGNYKLALTHYYAALDNYELSKHKNRKVGTLNNIGIIHLNLNNYDKALIFFEQALDATIEDKDSILVASVLNNLAIYYTNKSKEKAIEKLTESIQISNNLNNQYGLSISYQIMGNLYLNTNEIRKAHEAYIKSIEIARKSNLTHQLAIAKIGLGRTYLSQNKIDSALHITKEVMEVGDEQNSLVLKSEAYQLLSEVYKSNGDFEKSLNYYQEHINAQKELNNQTVINQVYDVEVNHLNQLNKMQYLELEKKELSIKNKNNLLFMVMLVFILVLIGLYLAYRNHRHKQRVKFQTTIIELNQKKSYAALEAEIQERKRIGKELHDSLGYLLSLAGLQASVLNKRRNLNEDKKNELLKSLIESIDEAFRELRSISHNLAPSLLSEYGLKGALKNISDKIHQSGKLKISFDVFGLEKKINPVIENVLFRTLQEIINNTIKHSEASELFIQIIQDKDQIAMMTEDNGIGFKTEDLQKKSNFGLYHIESSVENLNGTLFIDSKLNRGTIISITIPLKYNNDYGKKK